jgi:hypothetical protein
MQQIRVPMPPPHFEAPRPMRPMRPPLSPIEWGGSSRFGQTPANPPPYFLRNQTSSPPGPSPQANETNKLILGGGLVLGAVAAAWCFAYLITRKRPIRRRSAAGSAR